MEKKKHYTVDQYLSDIIHDFFNGNPKLMDNKNIMKVYNNKRINTDFKRIKESDVKNLKKIYKLYTRDIRINIQERSDKEYTDKPIPDLPQDSKRLQIAEHITTNQNSKYIDIHRKAYIDWINNDFITIDDKSKLNVYQTFIKTYLSEETPYRGLLVYHGLGTGKTATAIATAEGLSNDMETTTAHPWLIEPGSRDITSHVNLTVVESAAESAGAITLGILDQTYFLLGLGAAAHATVTKSTTDIHSIRRRLAMKSLLIPGGLGSTQKVMIFGKGVGTPKLSGLSFRIRTT